MEIKSNSNTIQVQGDLTNSLPPFSDSEDLQTGDYDSAWKDVIEKLFEPFLWQFFPHIAAEIDFAIPPEFMGLEFRPISSDSNQGKRIADVVAKVHLKNRPGKYILVYAHIEVHGDDDTGVFMERMFIYHYRVFDKYKEKGVGIVSLAILTDDNPNLKLKEYKEDLWGFELTMKIPYVRIADYKYIPAKIDELNISKNPMAMVIRAQLKSYEIKQGTGNQRYSAKRELMLECLNAGWSKQEIRVLFKFIDWIITLPRELQDKLNQEIIKAEKERNMNYIPTYEREAFYEGKLEGIKEGIKEGKQEGIKEGKLEEKKEIARELVKRGIDFTFISESVGLPIHEVEAIAVVVR